MYVVSLSAKILEHVKLFNNYTAHPKATNKINNMYELPSIEQAVRYLHGAAGSLTKETWLKAIRNGNYLTWPLITVKNVNKNFPESEETQKGHMRNQRQGFRSTKNKSPAQSVDSEPPPIEKKKIFPFTSTTPRKRCSRIKPGSFPSAPAAATTTRWCLLKLSETPPGSKQ